MAMSLVERFWSKVQKTETCRLWTGVLNNDGYGHVGSVLAHRYSWVLHHGSIASGLLVCHRCDVPACVNPAHLFLGTQRDNMLDCYRKGRGGPKKFQRGNLPKNSTKLTLEQVELIRKTYRSGGVSQRQLADHFGMGSSQISEIVRMRTWITQAGTEPTQRRQG